MYNSMTVFQGIDETSKRLTSDKIYFGSPRFLHRLFYSHTEWLNN